MRVEPGGVVRRDGLPVSVSVLVSDRCNHACAHCYQRHRRTGEMSLAELDHLFGELASAGVLFLQLSGGEPSLRSDLPEILRAARKHHFSITLATNAYVLSDDLIDTIVQIGVSVVQVSLYSDRAEEHDAVTGVAGSFEHTCRNIRTLRERGIIVVIGTTLTSHCTASTSRLRAFAEQLGCQVRISPWLLAREDGPLPSQVAATPDQIRETFQASIESSKPVTPREARLELAPCGACSNGLTIHSDGSVRSCYVIPKVLADARQPGPWLTRLLDQPEFKMLTALRWRNLHGCRDCQLMPWCSRCHGSAYRETGDLLGPQPEACRVAIARYEVHHGPLQRLQASDDVPPRSEDIGPFALLSGARLQPIADELNVDDEALRATFPWIKHPSDRSPR